MKTYKIILILMLFLSMKSESKVVLNDYKYLLKKSILNYQNCLTNDSGVQLTYQLKSIRRADNKLFVTENILLYNLNKIRYETGNTIILKDTNKVIYINKNDKTIYSHKTSDSAKKKMNGFNDLISMVEKSYNNIYVIDYKTTKNSILLSIKFNDKASKEYQNCILCYNIDKQNLEINSITIKFNSETDILSEIEFKVIEQKKVHNHVFFKNTLDDNIFARSGNLLPEYLGFTAINF